MMRLLLMISLMGLSSAPLEVLADRPEAPWSPGPRAGDNRGDTFWYNSPAGPRNFQREIMWAPVGGIVSWMAALGLQAIHGPALYPVSSSASLLISTGASAIAAAGVPAFFKVASRPWFRRRTAFEDHQLIRNSPFRRGAVMWTSLVLGTGGTCALYLMNLRP